MMSTRRRWAAVTDEPVKGKYVSYALSFRGNENLVWITRGHMTFNIMSSKQEALELTNYWNECYRKNGTLATY